MPRTRLVDLDHLPREVVGWVRRVFADCNRFTTKKLSDIPTVHEPQLDMSFIESLSREPAPPPSMTAGWNVYLETHFLGGRAMFQNWEIADIGLLIQLRQHGKLVRVKTGLLQSKRLYPKELQALPDLRRRYQEGFFALMPTDEGHREIARSRRFHFEPKSVYLAYQTNGEQEQRIRDYEQQRRIPVYYLFYNPRQVPWEATIPFTSRAPTTRPPVGCRVVAARHLATAFAQRPKGEHPSYADVCAALPKHFRGNSRLGGWRVEDFIANELLACREGYVVTKQNDESLIGLFFGRSGPISAAVSLTIDAPRDVELALPPPRETFED